MCVPCRDKLSRRCRTRRLPRTVRRHAAGGRAEGKPLVGPRRPPITERISAATPNVCGRSASPPPWPAVPTWGRLDALTEATVWIQDLLAGQRANSGDGSPSPVLRPGVAPRYPRQGQPAALRPAGRRRPHVLVLARRVRHRGAARSPGRPRRAPFRSGGAPPWRIWDIDLAFEFARQVPDDLLPVGSGIRRCDIDPDILREFKKSLRSAFDSVIESMDGNEFTLWLRPGTPDVRREPRLPRSLHHRLLSSASIAALLPRLAPRTASTRAGLARRRGSGSRRSSNRATGGSRGP